MSDVVAVGLITGAVGLISAYLSWRTAKLQGEASLAATKRQAEVELAKVTAENERLREQIREAERQNRQGTYHRLVATLDLLDSWALESNGADTEFEELDREYNLLHGGVLLFGDDEVCDALGEVSTYMRKARVVGRAANARSRAAEWRVGYLQLRAEAIDAQGKLIAAMRRDVTRGVLLP